MSLPSLEVLSELALNYHKDDAKVEAAINGLVAVLEHVSQALDFGDEVDAADIYALVETEFEDVD